MALNTVGAIGAGLTSGAASVQQYVRDTPNRQARVAEAKAQQARAETKLSQEPVRAEIETNELKAQLDTQNSQLLRRDTFDAFSKFDGSGGDVKYLNNFLADAKANPAGARMFAGTARVDKVTRTPVTERLLASAGVQDIDGFFESPEASKMFVLTTKHDGTQVLTDIEKLYATTGYTKYMNDQQMAELTAQATLRKALAGPQSADTNIIHQIAQDANISILDATRKYNEAKRSGGSFTGSALERIAANLRESDPELSYEESLRKARVTTATGTEAEREAHRAVTNGEYTTYDEAFTAVSQRKERTSPEKQLDAARQTRTELDTLSPDDSDFFEADLTDPVVRRKAGPLITELEKLTGASLTTEDKRTARNLRSLTALGKTAGSQLTAAETGPLDSMLKPLRRYVSDSIEGDEGIASYETFRNVFRNALYGASLTEGETKAFEQAAGKLGQQLGPVLSQLRVQLTDVKNQMQAIYDMNDPYIAQYYVGTDLDHIDEVIEAMDERLEYFTDSALNLTDAPELELEDTTIPTESVSQPGTAAPVAPPADRPTLDSLFGDL